jgi:hypothetical protein
VSNIHNLWVIFVKLHVILPEFVYSLKEFSFLRQLLLDILGIEDVLKIHPLSLESEPLVNHIRYVSEMLLPLFNLSSYFSNILRTHHCLNTHLVIFKLGNRIFHITNDESIFRVTIAQNCENCFVKPECRNLIQRRVNICFSTSKSGNFFNFLVFFHDTIVYQKLEREGV